MIRLRLRGLSGCAWSIGKIAREVRSGQCAIGCFGLVIKRIKDKGDLDAAVEVAVNTLDHGGGIGQIGKEGSRRAAQRRRVAASWRMVNCAAVRPYV